MKSTRPHRVSFKANGQRISFVAGRAKRAPKRATRATKAPKRCTCSRKYGR